MPTWHSLTLGGLTSTDGKEEAVFLILPKDWGQTGHRKRVGGEIRNIIVVSRASISQAGVARATESGEVSSLEKYSRSGA